MTRMAAIGHTGRREGNVTDSGRSGGRWRADAATLLRGAALGVVELVPGVSAGTLALLLGIYERLVAGLAALVDAVRAQLDAVRASLAGGRGAERKLAAAAAWDAVPWRFLIVLGVGMALAPVLFSHAVGAVLEAVPGPALAFFCGVVLVAVALPLRAVGHWRLPQVAALLAAGAAAVVLLGLPVGAAGVPELWFLALCGVVAAAVMVLPGVSGAFVLLVLGPYPYLIDVARSLTGPAPQPLPLVVFMLGALVGLAVVSRALTWLLQRAHGVTLAALSGLMLGSLRRLWPFLELDAAAAAAAGAHRSLHAVAKVPLTELVRVPVGELTAVLAGALAGALVAAVGVVLALRTGHGRAELDAGADY